MKEEQQTDILVITGTNRVDSNSEKIAMHYLRALEKAGVNGQLILLKDLPRDFAFADMWGERSPKMQQWIDERIEPARKFVFIIPEYNGGFPGVLKAFIDCIPPSIFQGKKAGLIGLSSGMAGGLRPMDQFSNVLNYLKVSVLYSKPKLSGIDRLLETGKLEDSRAIALIEEHAQLMSKF